MCVSFVCVCVYLFFLRDGMVKKFIELVSLEIGLLPSIYVITFLLISCYCRRVLRAYQTPVLVVVVVFHSQSCIDGLGVVLWICFSAPYNNINNFQRHFFINYVSQSQL
jgi:hypothetical protein